MKPVKMMYVLDSLANKGRVERVLIDKIIFFASHGYQVIVITYQQGSHPFSFDFHPSAHYLDTEWMVSHGSERRDMGQKAYQSVSRYRNGLVMKAWEQLFVSF